MQASSAHWYLHKESMLNGMPAKNLNFESQVSMERNLLHKKMIAIPRHCEIVLLALPSNRGRVICCRLHAPNLALERSGWCACPAAHGTGLQVISRIQLGSFTLSQTSYIYPYSDFHLSPTSTFWGTINQEWTSFARVGLWISTFSRHWLPYINWNSAKIWYCKASADLMNHWTGGHGKPWVARRLHKKDCNYWLAPVLKQETDWAQLLKVRMEGQQQAAEAEMLISRSDNCFTACRSKFVLKFTCQLALLLKRIMQ